MKVYSTIPANLIRYFTGTWHEPLGLGYLEFYKTQEDALKMVGPADKFLMIVDAPEHVLDDKKYCYEIAANLFPNLWDVQYKEIKKINNRFIVKED